MKDVNETPEVGYEAPERVTVYRCSDGTTFDAAIEAERYQKAALLRIQVRRWIDKMAKRTNPDPYEICFGDFTDMVCEDPEGLRAILEGLK